MIALLDWFAVHWFAGTLLLLFIVLPVIAMLLQLLSVIAIAIVGKD